MLNHYITGHSRYRDRGRTKERRRLLNSLQDGEPLWGSNYIRSLRPDSSARGAVSSYYRYIASQVGKPVSEIYSELSGRKVYRGRRYPLKERFLDEIQWEHDYYRDDEGYLRKRIEESVRKEGNPVNLPGLVTGTSWHSWARIIVWYPWNQWRTVNVIADAPFIWNQPLRNQPSFYRRGWWGLYVDDREEYTYAPILGEKGQPLFTKEEYRIRDRLEKHSYRTIPKGGPLLRESIRKREITYWDKVPASELDLWAHVHRERLKRLKGERNDGQYIAEDYVQRLR